MHAPVPRILVVDDEHDVQDVLIHILQERGYDVRAADDGNQALAAAKRRAPDIVLLDILMPDKDGLETILQLHREFPKIIIVAMSGASFDFLSAAQKFGAHHTIRKPIRPRELVALLEQIWSALRRSESPASVERGPTFLRAI
jgi:CheY-like chemotaxis protein